MCTLHIRHLGGKNPLPRDLRFPASYHLKYQINLTPCTPFTPPASRFRPRAITNVYAPYPSLGGQKPPLPHDLGFPASCHLKYRINLTPCTPFTPPASRFRPRAITNVYAPYPSLGGQKPRFRVISGSPPLTTSNIESTPPCFISLSRGILSVCARYPLFQCRGFCPH